MIIIFIHVFDKSTFEELKKRGAIPLKTDTVPYIMLQNENTIISFENIDETKFEKSDIMYF